MNNPKLYAKNNQFQRHVVTEVINEHLEKFVWRPDDKDTLIDVGSATGDMLMEVISPLMPKKFHRIVFSDLNPVLVEYAKSQYQHVQNSEFKVMDIGAELGIPNDLKGQFDHVLSFYCVHLVENQMKAFENIFSLLLPTGGDCLLNLWARGPYYDAYLSLSKTAKWSKYMTDINKYTCFWHIAKNPEQEARLMLEKCGFSDIEVNLCRKFHDFDNVETFKVTMLAVSPYAHQIPKELHQDFMDDFVEAVCYADEDCKILSESGDKFRFYFEQLVIYARKPSSKLK